MTTAVAPIAKLKGTFARPGVSKNRRWYKPEHIAAAVTEAQSSIDSGSNPFVMLTHHGARDHLLGDVTHTAARITKVGLDPKGNGTFEAEILGTHAGREVNSLTKAGALKGVSMASVWKGIPHTVRGPDGQPCETADGFTLKGIDFTHNPGVPGAEVEPTESANDLLYESIEETDVTVETIEESVAPAQYADPGYHGAKAFEITSPEQIRTAWVESHRKSITESYTPKQVQRIRSKVKGAAQKAGFDLVAETNLLGAEILEAYTSVCIDNGPADLRVAAYIDDPAKLAVVTQRVAMAAMAALNELDPDNDGDIDLPGDDDLSDCTGCGGVVTLGTNFCPSCGQPVPSTESTSTNEKEVGMSDTTKTEGAADESTLTITEADLAAKIAEGVKTALESAGVKPTEVITESAEIIAARKLIAEADAAKLETVITESASDVLTPEAVKTLIAEAVATTTKEVTEAVLDVARKEIQEAGPRRRGLVPKAILEQSSEDVYGETPLKDLDMASLERAADSAIAPLLSV